MQSLAAPPPSGGTSLPPPRIFMSCFRSGIHAHGTQQAFAPQAASQGTRREEKGQDGVEKSSKWVTAREGGNGDTLGQGGKEEENLAEPDLLAPASTLPLGKLLPIPSPLSFSVVTQVFLQSPSPLLLQPDAPLH